MLVILQILEHKPTYYVMYPCIATTHVYKILWE